MRKLRAGGGKRNSIRAAKTGWCGRCWADQRCEYNDTKPNTKGFNPPNAHPHLAHRLKNPKQKTQKKKQQKENKQKILTFQPSYQLPISSINNLFQRLPRSTNHNMCKKRLPIHPPVFPVQPRPPRFTDYFDNVTTYKKRQCFPSRLIRI